jgi:hypothetical protein
MDGLLVTADGAFDVLRFGGLLVLFGVGPAVW